MRQLLVLAGVIAPGAGSTTTCGGSGSSETEVAAVKEIETKEAEATKVAEVTADSTLGLKPLAERETLSISFFADSAHPMPWYVADKMGFFDKLNIDVEYQFFTGGPAMMEASADWDVCGVGGSGVLNSTKNYDMNMVGICDNKLNTGLFARPGTDLAKDTANSEVWRGRKVLLNRGTTFQYTFVQHTANTGIEDLEAYDIEIISTAVGTCLTVFRTGEGDALCVWDTFAAVAEFDGDVRIADVGKMNLNNISGICVISDAIENKMGLTSAAYQVYCKTWRRCKTSEENMAKAEELFMESCDDEGVAVTEKTVACLITEFQCTTLDEVVATMTGEEVDRNSRGDNVSLTTNWLFETLGFFIALGNYTEKDHQAVLDRGLVNFAIANAIK